MTIVPLPVFEEEADPRKRGLSDDEIAQYERLSPPETVVVRYGRMRHVAEFPCRIDVVPGCGTKFVARTPRGIEITEMLTTTCSNGGCGKSITRKQMLEYIDQSGGKKYPFTTNGRVLRVATPEDLAEMSSIRKGMGPQVRRVKEVSRELGLEMQIVDVEPILSCDHLTVYYMSESRVDFREMVKRLASEFSCRIEMRQVGARDEARLTADYERCGQHCCCRQFLKVLKPVPMRAAKVQKATLDPLKISGRCGRLMCCLRYEDATYSELKKRLPHKKTRVGTPDGPGIVLDTQILTQLVLVELEDGFKTQVATPVENLMDPETCPKPGERLAKEAAERKAAQQEAMRGLTEDEVEERVDPNRRRRTRRNPKHSQQDSYRERSAQSGDQTEPNAKKEDKAGEVTAESRAEAQSDQNRTKPRRRKRGGRSRGGRGKGGRGDQNTKIENQEPGASSGSGQSGQGARGEASADGDAASNKRRRRKRGKRGGRKRRNNRPPGEGGDNSGGGSLPPSDSD